MVEPTQVKADPGSGGEIVSLNILRCSGAPRNAYDTAIDGARRMICRASRP